MQVSIGVSHLVQPHAELILALDCCGLLLVNFFKYPFFQFGPRFALATGESLLSAMQNSARLLLSPTLSLTTMFTIQTAVTIVTAGIAVELFGVSTNIVYWGIAITFICLHCCFLVAMVFSIEMKIIILILSSTIIAAF